jgi:F0F1-type ATP synthase membrane subunit c/vacuolar-type H+-ATPase subunit K
LTSDDDGTSCCVCWAAAAGSCGFGSGIGSGVVSGTAIAVSTPIESSYVGS